MSPVPTGGLAGVKAGFEVMPKGVYTLEVLDATETKTGPDSKNPGSDMIKLELGVIDDEQWEGRKLWQNIVFTEKSKGMVKANLLALGYSEDELDDPDFEVDADDLIGRQCQAIVNVKVNPDTKDLPPAQQEQQNNIRRLLPVGSGQSELP